MMAVQSVKPTQSLHSLLDGMTDSMPDSNVTIEGLCIDSRRAQPGDLFMAMVGGQRHGLVFAADVVKKGVAAIAYENNCSLDEWPEAVIALDEVKNKISCIPVTGLQSRLGLIADRFYDHPSQQQFVIGITGTNGKTSCSHFIAEAISEQVPCGVIGTLGNGVFGRLQTTTHTTPDAVSVQRLLHEMRQQDVENIVMEVSSHGLQQGRVNAIAFDVAVFTNLSREHLDYHDNMESYAAAKGSLFEMPGLRYAVINIDDDYGRQLLQRLPESVQAVSYSIMTGNDDVEKAMTSDNLMHLGCVCAEKLSLTPEGISMKVTTPWGEGELHSHLLGRFNASNLLVVLAVLLIKGIRIQDALETISRLHTVPGRMQSYGGTQGLPLVVVDYAHTPHALEEVLTALSEHCRGDIWCVFGCGGDRDRGKRPIMGSVAENIADQVIVTDDNPRSELPDAITDDILGGMQDSQQAHVIHDRAAAIRYALQHARELDVVLVAGKGHEDYQLVGEERLHFSDSEVVEQWLAEVSA